ncbi:hypothetical protein BDV93DRAFT_564570 [Ceratobasidium sp. AG-I]|nr:hypothetical protein BDV93DRAFT_564570 [Ceratobasidium sp. AG-I]
MLDLERLEHYFDSIKVEAISNATWTPTKTWHKLHGENKSTSGGAFRIETMKATNGNYIAKVIGTGRAATVIAAAGQPPPSPADVIQKLRAAFDI